MDQLQEVKTAPPTPIEQQFQQFQAADVAAFPTTMDGTHTDPGIPPSHLSSAMPLYPSDLASDSMAMSMQMPSVTAMDLVNAPIPDHPPSTNMLASFAQQTGSGFLTDPPMSGIENLEATHHLLSSPSNTTASGSVSHVSSPALNGMVPSYVLGSSSLASALDGSRSRSGSAASPSHPPGNSSSDISFPSSNSGPPTSAHEQRTFPFASGYEQSFSLPQSKENSPDADPHLLVLGDMLKR